MCTAAVFNSGDCYFGRNLDYEYSYEEKVTITPRSYAFDLRAQGEFRPRYAMIGMAYVQEGYPLYYDATNEAGLSVAGLNFPSNAVYMPLCKGKINITPFEFIPYILGSCKDIEEARKLLLKMNIYAEHFSKSLPLSPLHWLIADKSGSIVAEPVGEGLKVYDNPVGVLTNNPPFDYHMLNLANYMALSPEQPKNNFAQGSDIRPYSRGMGAMGLPGDLSSASRFIKAAFTRCNSQKGANEGESVAQFFHILSSVAQQKGCCKVEKGFEYTIYSSCCNSTRGIYYYKTYYNSRVFGVDMHRENLDGTELICYPLEGGDGIKMLN